MDQHGDFRGCGLLNAAELQDCSTGRELVRHHKEQIQQLMQDQLPEANVAEPLEVASHLALIHGGAMSRAGLEGTTTQLLQARQIAANVQETQ